MFIYLDNLWWCVIMHLSFIPLGPIHWWINAPSFKKNVLHQNIIYEVITLPTRNNVDVLDWHTQYTTLLFSLISDKVAA